MRELPPEAYGRPEGIGSGDLESTLKSGRWESNPSPSAWKADVRPLHHARGRSILVGPLARSHVFGFSSILVVTRRSRPCCTPSDGSTCSSAKVTIEFFAAPRRSAPSRRDGDSSPSILEPASARQSRAQLLTTPAGRAVPCPATSEAPGEAAGLSPRVQTSPRGRRARCGPPGPERPWTRGGRSPPFR